MHASGFHHPALSDRRKTNARQPNRSILHIEAILPQLEKICKLYFEEEKGLGEKVHPGSEKDILSGINLQNTQGKVPPFCAPFSEKDLTFEIQKLYNFSDKDELFLNILANPLRGGDAKL